MCASTVQHCCIKCTTCCCPLNACHQVACTHAHVTCEFSGAPFCPPAPKPDHLRHSKRCRQSHRKRYMHQGCCCGMPTGHACSGCASTALHKCSIRSTCIYAPTRAEANTQSQKAANAATQSTIVACLPGRSVLSRQHNTTRLSSPPPILGVLPAIGVHSVSKEQRPCTPCCEAPRTKMARATTHECRSQQSTQQTLFLHHQSSTLWQFTTTTCARLTCAATTAYRHSHSIINTSIPPRQNVRRCWWR